MKKSFVAGAAATCLLPICLTAQASNHSSTYVGAKGDVAFPANSDIKGAGTGSVKYGFSSGIGGVLGWQPKRFDTNNSDLRFELEGSYHAFGLDTVGTNKNPSSDMKVTTLMGNMYYDWNTNASWSPYIGFGIGQAHVKFAADQGLGNTGDSDTVRAWQAMAGLSHTFPSMPNTVWSIGYKHLALGQPAFTSAGGNIKLDPVQENTIEMGFRHYF